MPYRFKPAEAVSDAVKRIVSEEIESSVAGLASPSPENRDRAVHQARKSIKKIRGLLRLLRPRLGATFRRENKRFRRLGRDLSQLRDAAALLEAVVALLSSHSRAIPPKAALDLRHGVEQDKAELDRQFSSHQGLQQTSASLNAARKRSRRWPVPKNGFSALEPGFKMTYRAGRKALAAARRHDDPDAFHRLRRRVKDHWYHVRLLAEIWPARLRTRETSLRQLEKLLGDDHNFAVLRAKVEHNPQRYGGPAAAEPFVALLVQQQSKLRKDALTLAGRLYREKPAAFTTQVAQHWHAWRKQKHPPHSPEPAAAA